MHSEIMALEGNTSKLAGLLYNFSGTSPILNSWLYHFQEKWMSLTLLNIFYDYFFVVVLAMTWITSH